MDYKDQINEIFRNTLSGSNVKVIIFGSRAGRNYSANSDYDFAIDAGEKIDPLLLMTLRDKFEDSVIPFKFDIVDVHDVSEILKKQIDETGKEWKFLK